MSSEALSHDEAIGQFCGVTGADEDRAKGLLEACDWNLELAINMHVDTYEGRNRRPGFTPSTSNNHAAGPSTSNASGAPVVTIPDDSIHIDDDDDDVNNRDLAANKDDNDLPPSRMRGAQNVRRSTHVGGMAANEGGRKSPPSLFYDDADDVRPPIPPVRQVLVQNPLGYPSVMPQRRYNTRTGVVSDVYDAFRDFQAEAQWQEMAQEGESSAAVASATAPSDSSSASSSTANNRKTLQDLFRPPFDILFHGSFVSAREVGSLRNKWLLVNIQNRLEFACQALNRDVWSNQAVKDILKEHFIFWQVDHDSSEGTRYIQFYKVTSFPHVSIVDPRTGEQMKSWPTSIDHNSFCDSVIEFLTEHPSPDGSLPDANTMKKLRVKEEDTARTLYDQSEEAQLEAAIKASLQETENSNSSSKAAFADEDSFTDAIESDNEQPPPPPPEVEDYQKYLGKDTEKFSLLVVRFPDGTRDNFRFPSDSTMKALFLLLTSKGYGMNQYIYVTNFPRRLLHELPDTDTLQDAKLIKENIFIERKVTPEKP